MDHPALGPLTLPGSPPPPTAGVGLKATQPGHLPIRPRAAVDKVPSPPSLTQLTLDYRLDKETLNLRATSNKAELAGPAHLN